MTTLPEAVRRAAEESALSGVVRVDQGDDVVLLDAYGLADRRHAVANTPSTRFATASATKGLTALTVMTVVEQGQLAFETTARQILGADLPLIADDVTVERLLAHRSGIGDYFDEDATESPLEYFLPVAVNRLSTTEDFLQVLDGHPTKFAAGERFSYCNGGYVVLALLAERVTGLPFHDLVVERVCRPAGMTDTAFDRSDELPPGTATGYLGADGLRTNVFHLPVRGSGDGGIYSTVADVHALWRAFLAGQIVSPSMVAEMVRPRSEAEGPRRYGLGFWLTAHSDAVTLEGYDAGVSFYSVSDPSRGVTATVISNTTDGAWPAAQAIIDTLKRQ
jgi:CubicO group peptidase (beta-lactamase class C family)